MSDAPKYECPQCGHGLRSATGSVCPECGFFIGPARSRYAGTIRYWRFLRLHRRLDILLIVLWLMALGLSYWVISLSPGRVVVVVTVIAAVGVVGLGHYLQHKRTKKRG